MVTVQEEEEGIRPYGPGKFSTILDSYAYEMIPDYGGADEEASFDDGRLYSLIRLDKNARELIREVAEDNGDSLTDDEDEFLEESVAVILFERSDGTVEASWFSDMEKADEEWGVVEEDATREGDET